MPDCDVSYPNVHEFVEEKTVIIGLNSMSEETGFFDRFLADGELGKIQTEELDKIISYIEENHEQRPAIIICVHHHPFIFPGNGFTKTSFEYTAHDLKDANGFMDIISNRVDVLLFGHEDVHQDFSKKIAGITLTKGYDIQVILSAGNTSNPDHPARLITINGPGNLKVEEISL